MFGDVERVPPTPKTYHKSNIPIGSDDMTDAAPKVTNGNGTMNGNGNANGTVATNGNGVAHENGNGNGHGNAKTNGTNGYMNGSRGTNGSRGKYMTMFFIFASVFSHGCGFFCSVSLFRSNRNDRERLNWLRNNRKVAVNIYTCKENAIAFWIGNFDQG